MRSRLTKRTAVLLALTFLTLAASFVARDHLMGDTPIKTKVLGAQSVQAGSNATGSSASKPVPPGQDKDKDAKGTFSVVGNTGGLYPGAIVRLPLSLSNPQSFGIRITELVVTVQPPKLPSPPLADVSLTPACTASHVEVGLVDNNEVFHKTAMPMSVSINLGKNGTAAMALWLRMTDAPEACQGATFPLIYSGSAVKS